MAHAHNPRFLAYVDALRERVREMTIEDFRARLAAGERLVLVDVREDHERAEGHISGSIHLGRGVLERDIESLIPDPATPLVLQCRGGYRSVLACESLARMGYANTWSLIGGYREWVERGLPVDGAPFGALDEDDE